MEKQNEGSYFRFLIIAKLEFSFFLTQSLVPPTKTDLHQDISMSIAIMSAYWTKNNFARFA